MVRWKLLEPVMVTLLISVVAFHKTSAQDTTSIGDIPQKFSSVNVFTHDGQRIEADKFCINADTITLITAMGVRYSYLRSGVGSVSFSQRQRNHLGGMLGALIGVSAGVAACAAIGDVNFMNDDPEAVNSSFLIPIGGLLGWFVGSHREKTIAKFDAESFWNKAGHLRFTDCK